jgi:hypothetical protein
MPLKDIKAKVAADVGIKLSSTAEDAFLLDKINQAAKELYTKHDLVGSMREQLFQLSATTQQLSLPYYIDTIRAVRDYETRLPIERVDMLPRYQTEGSRAKEGGLPWRIKAEKYPLKANIGSDGPLTFTLKSAATVTFNIVVIGATSAASRVQEIVNVAAGALAVTTTNNFLADGVERIFKSSTTDSDIVVTDIDGKEVADIPNSELYPSYTIVQVLDQDYTRGQTQLVEVLYKTRFTPFKNDYDSFPCGDVYDDAIYYLTLGIIHGGKNGDEWKAKAQMAYARAEQLVIEVAKSKQATLTLRMDFGTSRFSTMWNKDFLRRCH